jgi:predicted acyltransferase
VSGPALNTQIDSPTSSPSERLLTLDAARGVANIIVPMYAAMADALLEFPESSLATFLSRHLSHAEWHGLHFVDLGFPGFILTMAMSLVFAFRRRLSQGYSRPQLIRGLALRSAALFVVGFFVHGGFSVPLVEVAIGGILQRLALCIFFAGLIELTLGHRLQWLLLAAILLGYWAAMALIPVPGFGAGDYSPQGNLNEYVDKQLLSGHEYFVLSTPAAIATAMLGLAIGHVLISDRSKQAKAITLFVGGVAAVNLSLLWHPLFPINKLMWTSSFVLASGGVCCFLIAIIYSLIEILNIRAWAFPLIVVGRNPLIAYVTAMLIPFNEYAMRFAGNAIDDWLGSAHQLVLVLVAWMLWWLLMYWLYRRDLIVRI